MAEKLDSLGLWEGLSDATRQENIEAVARGAHPWSTELSPDVQLFVDGEDMAEGGAAGFLLELAPHLKALGVDMEVQTVVLPTEDKYVIAVNGRQVDLYAGTSWDEWDDPDRNPWYAATTRPLAVVNELLQAAEAPKRAFVLYAGGNDGVMLLVDPTVVQAVTESEFGQATETPVLPGGSALG